MANAIITFASAATAVTFWELVKQIGVQATRIYAPPAVATGLKTLDRLLPSLIAEGVSGDELEDRLRQKMGQLTGSDWSAIRSKFDPKAFLDTLNND